MKRMLQGGGESKRSLQTEAIHLEQMSKRRDIPLQDSISLGVCASACAHTHAGRCCCTNPPGRFWNSLKEEEEETRVKILSVYWHASLNFLNCGYVSTRLKTKPWAALTPKTMSKYLCIIIAQIPLPHGRYDFICNLSVR